MRLPAVVAVPAVVRAILLVACLFAGDAGRVLAAESPRRLLEFPEGRGDVDGGAGVAYSVIPGTLYEGETWQLELLRWGVAPVAPESLSWTSLTPLGLSVTPSGVATVLAGTAWRVRIDLAGGESLLYAGVGATATACAAPPSTKQPVPDPPAPRVKRLVVLNQYAADHVVGGVNYSEDNAAIRDAGEALRIKYANDEVILIRLGVDGAPNFAALAESLRERGVAPAELHSFEMIGHGEKMDMKDDDGTVIDRYVRLSLGSEQWIVPEDGNDDRIARRYNRSTLGPRQVASILGSFLHPSARVELHHCYSGERLGLAHSVAQALANGLRRVVAGCIGVVEWSKRQHEDSPYDLPDGHMEPATPQSRVPAAPDLDAVTSDPFRGDAPRTRVALPAGARVRIFNLAGRAVRTLEVGTAGDGSLGDVGWDGRDDSGRRAPHGIYFWARVDGAVDMPSRGRLLVLR